MVWGGSFPCGAVDTAKSPNTKVQTCASGGDSTGGGRNGNGGSARGGASGGPMWRQRWWWEAVTAAVVVGSGDSSVLGQRWWGHCSHGHPGGALANMVTAAQTKKQSNRETQKLTCVWNTRREVKQGTNKRGEWAWCRDETVFMCFPMVVSWWRGRSQRNRWEQILQSQGLANMVTAAQSKQRSNGETQKLTCVGNTRREVKQGTNKRGWVLVDRNCSLCWWTLELLFFV